MAPSFDGLLVIDKPSGITSRAALDRAAKWFPRNTRIGHTGTLDPLATGVLVVCVGAATRLADYVQAMHKIYRAGITLGATSDSDDADGVITQIADAKAPTRDEIERALATFVGTKPQVPPAYSAAKVAGRRAYSLARKGKEVSLEARPVTIERIDVLEFAYPCLDITVACGKGTYIRSLARDLGQLFGCGGYIASLRRLSIGAFRDSDALPLDAAASEARARLLPMWRAVQETPPLVLRDEEAAKLVRGQQVHVALPDAPVLAVRDAGGDILALIEVREGVAKPLKVLSGAVS
jgi:tRNA pseudouridine55 synthase